MWKLHIKVINITKQIIFDIYVDILSFIIIIIIIIILKLHLDFVIKLSWMSCV